MLEQWREKQNRSQLAAAGLLASFYNVHKRPSAESKSTEDFLPFPPPPKYLSEEESMAALDAFFGGIIKRGEAG